MKCNTCYVPSNFVRIMRNTGPEKIARKGTLTTMPRTVSEFANPAHAESRLYRSQSGARFVAWIVCSTKAVGYCSAGEHSPGGSFQYPSQYFCRTFRRQRGLSLHRPNFVRKAKSTSGGMAKLHSRIRFQYPAQYFCCTFL